MEFKENWTVRRTDNRDNVLIESDWNLKNLAYFQMRYLLHRINRIRLEFKVILGIHLFSLYFCINRIRLEFKGSRKVVIAQNSLSINRIRLEFKDPKQYTVGNRLVVLIESDWNLKIYNWIAYGFRFHCINRIRLEFKDRQEHGPPVAF